MSTSAFQTNRVAPYQRTVEEVLIQFNADARRGLSETVARAFPSERSKDGLTVDEATDLHFFCAR